jgi:hypothetical protein
MTSYTGYIPLEALPDSWQKHITRLRREASKHRLERNQARAELAALKARQPDTADPVRSAVADALEGGAE